MAFDPNAYGKPASKFKAATLSVQANPQAISLGSPTSKSLLQSKWSNLPQSKPEAFNKRQDKEHIPPDRIKKPGNVVTRSFSLLSSPRQSKAELHISEGLSAACDCADTVGNCTVVGQGSVIECTIDKQSPSQDTHQVVETRSVKVTAEPVKSILSITSMPACKDQTMDHGDQLRALQKVKMLQISQRTEGQRKRGKAKHDTVRLEDLYLARRRVDISDPSSSVRTWIEDSELMQRDSSELSIAQRKGTQNAPGAAAPGEDLDSFQKPSSMSKKRNSRWPSNADMRAPKPLTDENAWGSDVSNDTKANNSAEMSYGKLLNKKSTHSTTDAPLIDWEGNFMPPPADWHERPRYNNNNEAYKDNFDSWLSVTHKHAYFSNGRPVCIIPTNRVEDVQNHPDGISMINGKFRLGLNNIGHYGYDLQDSEEKASIFEPVDIEFKKEKENPVFAKFKHETTDILVTNWLKHRENARQLSTEAGIQTAVAPPKLHLRNDGRYVPDINVYLRPAVQGDLAELVRIYNSYVEHGIAPTDIYPIDDSQMLTRMTTAAQGKLPFIVAANMKQKGAQFLKSPDSELYSRQRALPVEFQNRQQLSRVETLAGFACAMDLAQPDWIERTSAELEVYVDPQQKHKGVGKCLLDRLLHICDHGHRLITNCNFHCAPEVRHFYESGGQRDLHKLYLLYRKWHAPKPVSIDIEGVRKHRKLPMKSTSEDDYNLWLRNWLENCGFQVEGLLKKVGAKHGRYVDLVYFGRETLWQPPDGHVPEPDPQLVAYARPEEDEEDEDEEGEGVAI